MKRILLALFVVVSPGLAQAGGLIDTNPIEKAGRNAQKKVKSSVDGEVDKHHVTVGAQDDAAAKPKKSGKKKASR